MSILNSVWKYWQLCGGLQSKVDEVLKTPLKARLLGTKPISTIGESWIIKSVPLGAHEVSKQKAIPQDQSDLINKRNHTSFEEDCA